jgi:hypothetical protein
MSAPMLAAIDDLRTAMSAFCDALEREVRARWRPPLADPAKKKAAAAATPPSRPPLPPDPTPARIPPLSDETRASSTTVALPIAVRIIAAVGGENRELLHRGLIGQLANERIAYDEALVRDVLDQALAQTGQS